MTKQIRIGITGGIGSGKSTIANIFKKIGYTTYISDEKATYLINTDTAIKKELILTFGKDIYNSENKINTALISKIVFSQKTALEKMNKIVHPRVLKDFNHYCALSNKNIVFLESAILFEIGWEKYFDYTICVTANEELRIRRACMRDNKKADEIKKRIANQLPDSEKIKKSNFTIYNDNNSHVLEQINLILKQI